MFTSTAPTAIDAIAPHSIRQALAAIRHVDSKARRQPSPLQDLVLVRARLRELGAVATDESRQWALASILEAIVTARLAACRPDAHGHRPEPIAGLLARTSGREAAREQALAAVAADFRAGDRLRECWSAIHSRFISSAVPSMDDVARAGSIGRVTLARRLNEGLELLADALRQAEIAAAVRAADSPPIAPRLPAERLQVQLSEAPPSAPADRLAGRVLAALRAADHAGLALNASEAALLINSPAIDLTALRIAKVAAWSHPRHALNRRFVQLSLMLDAGESHPAGRWQARETFDGLAQAFAAAASPVVALLGAPGSGKTSLLGHFELDEAAAGLRDETERVTHFVPASRYRAGGVGSPAEWLAADWRQRFPQLPPWHVLLAAGRLTLLLDGLNEMPHRDAADFHDRVAAWRGFLGQELAAVPGNRAIISCRSLDYSATLSSAGLRVPQLVIEPLDSAQVQAFLHAYRPARAAALWDQIERLPEIGLMRSPFVLRVLCDEARADDAPVLGSADLFSQMVRHAIRRELERDRPALRPGPVLDERDIRQVNRWRWRSAHDLPERGMLVPGLVALAYGMQVQRAGGDGGEVRLPRADALDLIGAGAAGVMDAGLALGLLDEDVATDEVRFGHQLVQEYFVARALARTPEPERVRQAWRAADLAPDLRQLVATLPAGEPLPALPTTGWEEAVRMAAAMSSDAEAFVAGVQAVDVALAGGIAAQPDVRARLGEPFVRGLQSALLDQSQAGATDLRARVAACRALGALGDPRYPVVAGPCGNYIAPRLMTNPAGDYPLGRSTPFEALGQRWWPWYAPHRVALGAFDLGQHPVTNAEWTLFMAAGGYDDPRWWPTLAAAAWRQGEGTTLGIHASVREWVARYRANPELLEATWRAGMYADDVYERWRQRMTMADAELEQHLTAVYPVERRVAPRFWTNARFNHPAQPVVGITWYEATAYCRWLGYQIGRPIRLPSDAELEAAARGRTGRSYPWGRAFDALRANSVATRMQTTTPIGVFPAGATPEGLSDLAGNVEVWTATLAEVSAADGPSGAPRRRWRAELDVEDAPATAPRVVRGGSFLDNHSRLHNTYGVAYLADLCPETVGLRVACTTG